VILRMARGKRSGAPQEEVSCQNESFFKCRVCVVLVYVRTQSGPSGLQRPFSQPTVAFTGGIPDQEEGLSTVALPGFIGFAPAAAASTLSAARSGLSLSLSLLDLKSLARRFRQNFDY
jgi:hypothetical protein